MKYIVGFIIAICLHLEAYSQNVIFESGFENNFNNEWQTYIGESSLVTYQINAASKNTGSNGFEISFNGTDQKGNLTTNNTINWVDGKLYRISFYYKAIVPSDNSDSNIKIFKSDGTKLTQFNFSLSNANWTKYSTDYKCVDTDQNGSVLFSIRPATSGNGNFYFDDFLIEEIIETPIETTFFDELKSKNVQSDESVKWVQFGPGMSGNNKSAFWHPTDPNVLFIGPNMGNSYRSTDKGLTYETILDEDGAGFKTRERGPEDMTSIDFSRQNPNFGFCTDEKLGGMYKTVDKGKTWVRLSSSKIENSYLACVAVDPKNENIWYLGAGKMRQLANINFTLAQPNGTHTDPASEGKIWKSIDGGSSWVLMANNGLNSKAQVETVYVDSENSSVLYTSTNYGFFKSVDGGANWQLKINGLDNEVVRSFTVHHNKTTGKLTMYVFNNVMWQADGNSVKDLLGGVFKSVDRGETWTKASGGLAIDMSQFQNNTGIKKSYYNPIASYFGITAAEAESKFPNLPTSITQKFNQIMVDPNDPNNVYMNNEYSNASDENFKPGQVWRSKDGGLKWYITFRNGKNWNSGNDISYWENRGNPIGTNITLKYKGEWLNRDDYEQKGCNFIQFNADGTVLHTQLAKISLMSYDKGDTWVDIDDFETSTLNSYVGAGNSNVPGHGFFQHPLLPNKVFCSAGENKAWVTNNEGDQARLGAQAATYIDMDNSQEQSGSCYAIHPTDTNIHYAMFFRQYNQGKLMRSLDSGKTWAVIGDPLPLPWIVVGGGDQSIHQLNLMMSKENPDYMYFNVPKSTLDMGFVGNTLDRFGVHRSKDGGFTWEQINSGLPASLDVAAIAFDPNNNDILYAAVQNKDGGLFKSVDKGTTWIEVASTTSIKFDNGINDIHFAEDGKVYITSGYKYTNPNEGGLWVSADSMKTWKRIFDYPWVNRVETALKDPNTILISTLANIKINQLNPGVFLSKDGGDSWIKINKGNGQSDRVNDIAIDNFVPGKYYASTYGSGWYVALDPNPNKVSFSLAPSNFNIKSLGETCSGKNNGGLTIEATEKLNYSAVLKSGSFNKTIQFSDKTTFENLKPETYSLCITFENQPEYMACFEVVISAAEKLTISSKIDLNSETVFVELSGANQYTIQLNNETFQTSEDFIELNLKEGENKLIVASDKVCQNAFKETIIVQKKGVKVYPNPTEHTINLSGVGKNALLKIYAIDGKLVYESDNLTDYSFDVSSLNSGVYVYKIIEKLDVSTGKIIKK